MKRPARGGTGLRRCRALSDRVSVVVVEGKSTIVGVRKIR